MDRTLIWNIWIRFLKESMLSLTSEAILLSMATFYLILKIYTDFTFI